MNNVRCWNCGTDFEVSFSSPRNSTPHPHIQHMLESSTMDNNNVHDIFCLSHYPHLIDVEQCRWCHVLKKARRESYAKGWEDGYEIGTKGEF